MNLTRNPAQSQVQHVGDEGGDDAQRQRHQRLPARHEAVWQRHG